MFDIYHFILCQITKKKKYNNEQIYTAVAIKGKLGLINLLVFTNPTTF